MDKKIIIYFFIILSCISCFTITGCASTTRTVDTGDIGISREIQQQLEERNDRLENTIDNIEAIVSRAEKDIGNTGSSLEELRRLIQNYFRIVRDLQNELENLRAKDKGEKQDFIDNGDSGSNYNRP